MKKTFVLSLCIALTGFVTSNLLQAQQASKQFGIKTGLNLADIVDNNDLVSDDFEFTNARFFHAGVFANHFFNEHFGAGIEILYNQKGGQNKLILNNPESEYKLRFDYLSLPILAKYRFHNLHVEAGPEFSYRLNLQAKSDQEINQEFLETIWDKDFEVSVLLGLFYQIKKLQIGVRYDFGLSSLSEIVYTDVNGEPISDKFTHKNRVLQISVGYAFMEK